MPISPLWSLTCAFTSWTDTGGCLSANYFGKGARIRRSPAFLMKANTEARRDTTDAQARFTKLSVHKSWGSGLDDGRAVNEIAFGNEINH